MTWSAKRISSIKPHDHSTTDWCTIKILPKHLSEYNHSFYKLQSERLWTTERLYHFCYFDNVYHMMLELILFRAVLGTIRLNDTLVFAPLSRENAYPCTLQTLCMANLRSIPLSGMKTSDPHQRCSDPPITTSHTIVATRGPPLSTTINPRKTGSWPHWPLLLSPAS